MNIEIERKFLVRGDYQSSAYSCVNIIQGYLSSVPERSVRIRIADEKAYLAIKGLGNESGASRYEWEKEIAIEDAKELIKLCEPGVIEKKRYCIKNNGNIFEVDEFFGENRGLVVAEIELKSEDQSFEKPEWLDKEVTGIKKYYNASLSHTPYKDWEDK